MRYFIQRLLRIKYQFVLVVQILRKCLEFVMFLLRLSLQFAVCCQTELPYREFFKILNGIIGINY